MIRFKPMLVLGCLVVLMAGRLPSAVAAGPATQPSGTIVGKITSQGEVPLSELVIYLESDDAGRRFAAPSVSEKISQKGAKFSPPLVIVCVGQTVDFLNDEDRPIEHNVFSNAPAKRFDLGLFRPGEARSVTFDKPGAVFLYCSIHRYMDGVIYVAPTPYFSKVTQEGMYQIEGVPPGIWTVKTWQRRKRFPEESMPVNVKAGETVTAKTMELRKK